MAKKYVDHFKFNDTGDMIYVKDAEAHTEIDALNQHVNKNSDDISLIKNRKFVLIGDSYAGFTVNWMDTLISTLQLVGTVKSSKGGASFSNVNNSFTSLLNMCANDTKVTDIIVGGGYNDITWSESDHRTGMTSFANLAKQKFPNAKVHLANFGWTTNATHYVKRLDSLTYYRLIGSELGFDFYDGCEYILHSYEDMREDGYHPTDQASKKIGLYLANCIKTGSCNPLHKLTRTILIPNTGWTVNEAQNILCSISNGMLELISNDLFLGHAAFGLTCDGRIISIGTYKTGLLVGQPNNFLIHNVTAIVQRNVGGYQSIPIDLHFCNGELSFSSNYVDPSDAGKFYYIEIKGLQIPKIKFNCSAIIN